jgi:hypothetical protein
MSDHDSTDFGENRIPLGQLHIAKMTAIMRGK